MAKPTTAQKIFDLFLPFFKEAEKVSSVALFIDEDRFNESDVIINDERIDEYCDFRFSDFAYKVDEVAKDLDKIVSKDEEEIAAKEEMRKSLAEISKKALGLGKDDPIVDICNKYFDDSSEAKNTIPMQTHAFFIKLIGRIKWPHDYQENVRAIIHRDGTIIVDDNENFEYVKVKADSPFKETP